MMKLSRLSLVPFVCSAAFSCSADTFSWPNDQSGLWSAEGLWTSESSARNYPGEEGDAAVIGANADLTLDVSPVLSALTMTSGRILPSASGPQSITLRAADAETPLPLVLGGNGDSRSIKLGEDYSDDNLDIVLDGSIACNYPSTSGNKTTSLYLNGRVRGGSSEAPARVTFTKANTGWTHAVVYLMRNDNDFRGDFTLRSGTGDSSTMRLRVGRWNKESWNDGALGHKDNQFTILGKYTTMDLTRFDTERGLRHRINGNATLRCASFDDWDSAGRTRLVLEDGFVAAPCSENSDYGKLTISAKPVVWRPAAEYQVDVGLDGNNAPVSDCIQLTSSTATEFKGRVVINAHGTIPEGTAFTILTVAKEANSFAFNPSETTEGWNFKCTGDADNGWTVVATKARDGADVSNYPISLIADDHVTANCEVLDMGELESLTVRVYYGRTDGENIPSAWSGFIDYPAVTAAGRYSLVVPGLVTGQNYYFRHAVMLNGDPVFSLDPSVSCETVPVSHPDSFTWVAGDAAWDAEGVWSINTPYERKTPAYAEDLIRFVYDGSYPDKRVALSEDRTVGNVYCNGGAWNAHWSLQFSSEAGAALVFDNKGAGSRFEVHESGLENAWLGTSIADALVLRLDDDLTFERNAAFGHYCRIFAKVTGGTTKAPHMLTFRDSGNEYANTHFYLLNAANDFVGKVTVERVYNSSSTVLHLGEGAVPYADTLLGHPANSVELKSAAQLQVGTGVDAVIWTRALSGNGTLNSLVPLQLGAAPITAAASGVLTLKTSGALRDTDATTYHIPVDPIVDPEKPSVSGGIAFDVREPLTLNGRFVIEPTDPTVKIENGVTWTVGSIAATAGSLGKVRFRANQGFHVRAEGDAELGWTLVAEKVAVGTVINIR